MRAGSHPTAANCTPSSRRRVCSACASMTEIHAGSRAVQDSSSDGNSVCTVIPWPYACRQFAIVQYVGGLSGTVNSVASGSNNRLGIPCGEHTRCMIRAASRVPAPWGFPVRLIAMLHGTKIMQIQLCMPEIKRCSMLLKSQISDPEAFLTHSQLDYFGVNLACVLRRPRQQGIVVVSSALFRLPL
jgi:hypothetical protein